MKKIIKKISEGLRMGLGFCAGIFAIDKIFKPKMEVEIITKDKEESK